MNKAEFIERYGNRYSHCPNIEQHPEHSWTYRPDHPAYLASWQDPWWCSGEAVDLEDDTGSGPKCVAHGFAKCPACSQNDGKAECEHCGYSSTGMHWDTCPNRNKNFPGGSDQHNRLRVRHYPDEHGWETDKTAKKAAVENRALPVRWADRAMFKAEPIATEEGPKVYLLWMTPDPLGAIAAACKMYKGEVVRDLSQVTDDERIEYFQQVQKTKLKAPFEFVKFHFLIEGVTRAFTHQMVRQRTAVYAQESLRFAVLGDEEHTIPVGLPPSLSGTDDWNSPGFGEPTDAERMRLKWEEAVDAIDEAYGELIDMGMPAEDARGLLPHNTLTRLHYSTDLRALLDHAGNRLCTQAQFEWRLVFSRIIEAIRDMNINDPVMVDGVSTAWMTDQLSGLFKPVCYQTGKCEFKANFDRACSIRDRVDANEKAGRPSSEWDKTYHNRFPTSDNPWVEILPIKPGEWLLDPGAARKK